MKYNLKLRYKPILDETLSSLDDGSIKFETTKNFVEGLYNETKLSKNEIGTAIKCAILNSLCVYVNQNEK